MTDAVGLCVGAQMTDIDIGAGVMLFLQVLQVAFLIVTSIKLAKQVKHNTATLTFLLQSYASTVSARASAG